MKKQKNLMPAEIVKELDRWIIGQNGAKKAVAVALRNRWRRSRIDESMRDEVAPKNILMIGPTGVGKTEIARRLAVLVKAPFIKVEATKFTEVGYVGRDVDSIIRDLAEEAVFMFRSAAVEKVEKKAEKLALARVIKVLKKKADFEKKTDKELDKLISAGDLDEEIIEIDVVSLSVGVEIVSPPGMEEMTSQLQNLMQNVGADRTKVKKMPVKDAVKVLAEDESAKLINEDEIVAEALDAVEQHGIVFIDEIDKVARRSDASGPDISREGVQRDLLPLVEGSTVTTKYGPVKTDHILFIASGAFHFSKPSDLIPELQGRLPNRVELKTLNVGDFVRILTEPDASLCRQYTALLATENVDLSFSDDAVEKIAWFAHDINEKSENIGARRLYTVMEKLLEAVSYTANDMGGQSILVDVDYVQTHIGHLVGDSDLSKYIL